MAIQIPNPGTGNGATGDNEFVLWSKTKDNFTDQTNAASRLVGTENGNLAEMQSINGVAGTGWGADSLTSITDDVTLPSNLKSGVHAFGNNSPQIPPSMGIYGGHVIVAKKQTSARGAAIWLPYSAGATGTITVEAFSADARIFFNIYTDKNTKLDTNGAITPSSPTIDLYSDRIETNEDGARMNPEFVRNGVGDYTIKNTTGLRDEGWYIKIPNDMNGNPKVAVTVDTDKDGNLNIKTYNRTFSLETFIFGPDLETPLDIPEGRWIDLRFNDLPDEIEDDTQTEV